ncbi:MAG: SBBP repeat-containing protein [Blastocatellia bacterium]|nr:SBBP repeat-containing protein [Blastocatellia bacterium]
MIAVCGGMFGAFRRESIASAAGGRFEPDRSRGESQYGRLPLRFEAERDGSAFAARGLGYGLRVNGEGVALRLRRRADGREGEASSAAVDLRMRLVGGDRRATGRLRDPQPGRSNYLIGADSRRWRTGVQGYGKLEYDEVYPGIGIVYYGSQRRLEYDFVVAPGASPSRIRMAFEGATALRVDEGGDLCLSVDGEELRLLKPALYQETAAGRRRIDGRYRIHGGREVGFEIGAYDRSRQLVIDPVLLYSSYLGGVGLDRGWGVAVDRDGSAYIVGETDSPNFPSAGTIQPVKGSGIDAFVLKLNPSGTAIVYATYLGGGGGEIGFGIAVDSAGVATIAGTTGSSDFPTTAGVVKRTLSGGIDGFVARLNAAGNGLIYSTYLGGNSFDYAYGLAVDGAGNAYITGQTQSNDLPANGVQSERRGSLVHRSEDRAGSWAARESGLAGGSLEALAVGPPNGAGNESVMYAATRHGLFRSLDGGGGWAATGNLSAPILSLAIDPVTPATIYAGTLGGIYKSVNGGGSFTLKPSMGANFTAVYSVLIDPASSNTIYVGTDRGFAKSADGGDTWSTINNGFSSGGFAARVNRLAAAGPSTIYGATEIGVFRTSNGGAAWAPANGGLPPNANGNPGWAREVASLAVDPVSPNILYAATVGLQGRLYKSTDGGANWAASDNGLTIRAGGQPVHALINDLAIDPSQPAIVYAATALGGVFKSGDGGATWGQANSGLSGSSLSLVRVDRNNPGRLWIGARNLADAYVARLNSSGTAFGYLTYLGGYDSDLANGIAIDGEGNAFIAGTTYSNNFPTVNAVQATYTGVYEDAFVTKLNASGGALVYSTYLGGGSSDGGSAIAVNAAGNAFVTGYTFGSGFPLVNSLKAAREFDVDAFVAKFSVTGGALEFSTLLGGSGRDWGYGIAVDSAGSVHVTGEAGKADFPATGRLAGVPVSSFPDTDAFVAKLPSDGARFTYLVLLGGTGTDRGHAIATDGAGAAYVAGQTGSTDFPRVNPAQSGGGAGDGFISKLGLGPDLALSMVDSPDPVLFGENLRYTVTVSNNGEVAATGVRLTNDLPGGASLVSVAPSRGACSGTTRIDCDLGALNVGQSVAVEIIVKPPATAEITNTATATAVEPDIAQANNTAEQRTRVRFADLAVAKTMFVGAAAPGARVVYLIRASNVSGETAADAVVSDALPAQLTFVSCSSADGGVCGGVGNSRTITFPALAAGDSKSAILVGMVNGAVANGASIANTASIASALPDPVAGNNLSSATFTAEATPLRVKQNGRILFLDESGLRTIAPTGGTSAPFQQLFPSRYAWSPDGTRIAFLRPFGIQGNYELRLVNADGSGERALANGIPEQAPIWSPDSASVLYLSANGELFAAGGSGGGPTRLLTGLGAISQLDLSPDGTKFAFVREGDIYAMNADGSDQRRLTSDPAPESSPRWSPDGTRLLFARFPPPGQTRNAAALPLWHLWKMNADGGDPQRFVNETARNGVWSPDGKQIAFEGYQRISGEWRPQIFVMNTDGSGATNLMPAGRGTLPEWQPLPTSAPLIAQPAPGTFSLNGRVVEKGLAIPHIQLSLSGTRAGVTSTDREGRFSFGNLPQGGDFTVRASFVFPPLTPATRVFTNLRQNGTADFETEGMTHPVSGRTIEPDGRPLAGVDITLEGAEGVLGVIRTDAEGRFGFPAALANLAYTLSPRAPFVPAFQPASVRIQDLSGPRIYDFVSVGYRKSVRGRIVDPGGSPVAGVTMTLSGGGAGTTTSDAQGNYEFTNIVGNADIVVTPSRDGATFAPARRVFSKPQSDKTANFVAGATPTAAVSAASFRVAPVTPDSIVAVFGAGMAGGVEIAATTPLPTTLGEVSVLVEDANGIERLAPLFFISPNQINLLVPAETAVGEAVVKVRRSGRIVAGGAVQVERVLPALFAANANGQGVAAAVVYRLLVTGPVYEPVAGFDAGLNRFVSLPIAVGPEIGPQPFLILFGSGLRNRSSMSPNITARIGGIEAPVLFAGAQGGLAGLDQINIEIPRSLAGRGEVDVVVSFEGVSSNPVQVRFR